MNRALLEEGTARATSAAAVAGVALAVAGVAAAVILCCLYIVFVLPVALYYKWLTLIIHIIYA